MATYDLIYIALMALATFMLVKSGIRLFRYRQQEKEISPNSGGQFLFTSYHAFTQLFSQGLVIWLLAQQPFEKGSLYTIILICVFSIHMAILLIRWPKEILTIEQDRLNFRLGKPRKLDEIKGVTIANDHLIIHAKNHPKKTRFNKSKLAGDWDDLHATVLDFVSQNPEIVIKRVGD